MDLPGHSVTIFIILVCSAICFRYFYLDSGNDNVLHHKILYFLMQVGRCRRGRTPLTGGAGGAGAAQSALRQNPQVLRIREQTAALSCVWHFKDFIRICYTVVSGSGGLNNPALLYFVFCILILYDNLLCTITVFTFILLAQAAT